jgi:hypothetical protein
MMPKFSMDTIRIWAMMLKHFRLSTPNGRGDAISRRAVGRVMWTYGHRLKSSADARRLDKRARRDDMLARVIVQIGLFLALQGAVLFVAAGTVEWPGAWTFLGIMGAGSLAISVWLLKHDPVLLAERLSPVV